MMRLIVGLTLCCVLSVTVKADDELNRVDRSHWLDPHEFIQEEKKEHSKIAIAEVPISKTVHPRDENKDLYTKIAFLDEELKDCQYQSHGPDVKPYYKQFISTLLELFKNKFSADDTYVLTVHLTPDQLSVLQTMVSESTLKPGHLQDSSSVLLNMIKRVDAHNDTGMLSHVTQAVEEYTGLSLSLLVQVLNVSVAVLACAYLGGNVRLSWMRLCVHVLFVLLLISIPWTWLHLYKIAVAEKTSEYMKHGEIPVECRPKDMSWQYSFTTWFKDAFTWSEDACRKYHESVMVDPFLEVPPTKALAVAVSRLILQPCIHIGETLNQFFQASLKGLPLPLIPVVLLFSLFIVVFLLLLLFRYSFSIPFLLSIKPTQPQNSHDVLLAVEQLKMEAQQLRSESRKVLATLHGIGQASSPGHVTSDSGDCCDAESSEKDHYESSHGLSSTPVEVLGNT